MSSTPTENAEAVTQQVELLKKSTFIERVMAVSYTHLTLPTILLV